MERAWGVWGQYRSPPPILHPKKKKVLGIQVFCILEDYQCYKLSEHEQDQYLKCLLRAYILSDKVAFF